MARYNEHKHWLQQQGIIKRRKRMELNNERSVSSERRTTRTNIGTKKLKNIRKKAVGLKYPAFLKTEYWKSVRQEVLKRDGFKCTECPATEQLHVHHKTYTNHFNEHLNLKDLITLCKNCHKKEHNK